MKKRVGIFGGSFDPVHLGHVRIANSFLKSGLIEELLVLPAPYPPHKKEKNQTAFSHRHEMLRIAFKNIKDVIVSDLEQKLSKPSYTLQTIEYLQTNHPNNLYYLCMGEDSLQDFYKWHKQSEILDRVDLLVAERPGFDSAKINPDILEHTIFVEHEPYPISSTEIRQAGGKLNEDLPDKVADYIQENNLYR